MEQSKAARNTATCIHANVGTTDNPHEYACVDCGEIVPRVAFAPTALPPASCLRAWGRMEVLEMEREYPKTWVPIASGTTEASLEMYKLDYERQGTPVKFEREKDGRLRLYALIENRLNH